jgi:hypothetical protein
MPIEDVRGLQIITTNAAAQPQCGYSQHPFVNFQAQLPSLVAPGAVPVCAPVSDGSPERRGEPQRPGRRQDTVVLVPVE